MPELSTLQVGDELPSRAHLATNVSLFLYNAVVWNAHRIHYDERYTTAVEGHPGIVIDGPLQGDWLTQVVLDWLGTDGRLLEFEYSNRRAAYLGQTLTAGGSIAAIDPARGEIALDRKSVV
jgi:3-methylfumaryl-CoA hydratase